MTFLLVFLICLGASTVGAICGVGGGIIIKPLLDSLGIMDVATLSFLSGCTVLAMTTYSVINSRRSGQSHVERHTCLPLALGAAVGGVLGKQLFQTIRAASPNPELVGGVQAACLVAVTFGTLVYTLYKSRIPTQKVTSPLACAVIGLLLGCMSSFLGIGGGPINLVVLFYFFSMGTKAAAENSLYIIFFSQTASILASMATGSVPAFSPLILLLMCGGGICGGVCGRKLNKKLSSTAVDKLFILLMTVMILLNLYNVYLYF